MEFDSPVSPVLSILDFLRQPDPPSRCASLTSCSSSQSSFTTISESVIPSPKSDNKSLPSKPSILPPRHLTIPVVRSENRFPKSSTIVTQTCLHFTALPILGLDQSTFHSLSLQAAKTLLHPSELQHHPILLSSFATCQSKVQAVCDIPAISTLPLDVAQELRGEEWDYYALSDSSGLPSTLAFIDKALGGDHERRHYVAVREMVEYNGEKVLAGFEKVVFGPSFVNNMANQLIIRSTCRLMDSGSDVDKNHPAETFYLLEESHSNHPSHASWWIDDVVREGCAESHELVRSMWDDTVRILWNAHQQHHGFMYTFWDHKREDAHEEIDEEEGSLNIRAPVLRLVRSSRDIQEWVEKVEPLL